MEESMYIFRVFRRPVDSLPPRRFRIVNGLLCTTTLLLSVIIAGCSGDNPASPSGVEHSDRESVTLHLDAASSGNVVENSGSAIKAEKRSCTGFKLEAKHSYIRSYPGGGGVFIVRLNHGDDFTGVVGLRLSADPALNARLDRRTLSRGSNIAEIVIRPSETAAIRTYQIDITACQLANVMSLSSCRTISVEVEMIPWGPTDPRDAIAKRDPLVEWIQQTHPEFGTFSDKDWYPYMTYPGIWIVEHWTFLNEEWEMRTCFHVMIPPYDWSMIQLRRHGEWDPIFAAKREHNGTTYEINQIPVSEYPQMCGY
jgi:hypothetical protein